MAISERHVSFWPKTDIGPDQREFKKSSPGFESGAAKRDQINGYYFVCGLALSAGVSFEPLWLLADMYICRCLVVC